MPKLSQHDFDVMLAEQVSQYYDDPLGFVLFAYPWGEEGTPLANKKGPRKWQWEFLEAWGEEIRSRGFDGMAPVLAIEMSVASGHGVGKSALTSWCIHFLMSTRRNAQGCVTATSSTQLRTKTWGELSKWHAMFVARHWFKYSNSLANMSLVHVESSKWRCDAITCAKENSEAFAGLHAEDSSPFYIFDEASGVPDEIWEVSDGGLTDGEPHRLSFGNGTRNSGRFYRRHHQERNYVKCFAVDSREVDGTNKEYLDQKIEMYGEDSDYAKVRIRGMFPSAGDRQFIPSADVEAAMRRETFDDYSAPVVIGVDVARFGDDKTVIMARHGRDVRSFPIKKFGKLDTMQVAYEVVNYIKFLEEFGRPYDGIIIDGTGVGGGVIDRLKELKYRNVFEMHNSWVASDPKEYANKGAEMWGTMRTEIQNGLALPNDIELRDELTTREYFFRSTKDGVQLILESKDDLKSRGEASPDIADALALTFALPISKQALNDKGLRQERHKRVTGDYRPY